MKKTAVFAALTGVVLLFCAAIFEPSNRKAELFGPDLFAVQKGGLKARINGSIVEIKKRESRKTAEQVMEYYAGLADERQYELYDSDMMLALARYFINAGWPDRRNWYYLFYVDDKGNGNMIAACNLRSKCGVINAVFGTKGGQYKLTGFNDAIKHYRGAVMFLSVEILSDGRTSNFANFYRVEGPGMAELKGYYEDELQKRRWNILQSKEDRNGDTFFIQKNGKDRVLNIHDDGGIKWVSVIG